MINSKGTIRWYSPKNGYGYITNESGREIFFKKDYLCEEYTKPKEGDRVVFELKNETRGPIALNILKDK